VPGHTEVTQAVFVNLGDRPVGPGAGVESGQDADAGRLVEFDAFAAADCEQLLLGYAGGREHSHGLVGADDGCPGAHGDALRAEEVIEVGVTDQNPVRLVDVTDADPALGGGRDTIKVGIEEDRQALGGAQPEGRAAVPI